MDGAPRLTIEERILLVLADHIRFWEEFEVPSTITQEGLARAVGAIRPNIARSLKSLRTKGMVLERVAHVAGHRRRKKVYLVQPDKVEEVLRLRDQTASIMAGPDMGSRTLGEISKERGVPLHQVYGDLVLRATVRTLEGRTGDRSAQQVRDSDGGFFGRKDELRRLADWLGDDRRSFALIWGMAGIGKSALIERFVGQMKGWEVVHYRFKPLNSLTGVVHTLEVALSTSLMSDIEDPGRNGMGNAKEDLVRDLVRALSSRRRSLLVLDDLHLASKDFLDLLTSLIAHDIRGMKVLAASRTKGRVYNARDAGPTGKVLEIELMGLSLDEGVEMLTESGVPRDAAMGLVTRCDGHPLALSLASYGPSEARATTAPAGGPEGFFLMEVIGKLSAEELSALRLLSIFRVPLKDPFSLLRDAGSDPSLVDSLSNIGLVRNRPAGFEVHPLIAEAATKRLDKGEWTRLHSLAADHHLKESWDLDNVLEASFHLSSSGRLSEMVSLLWDDRTMVLEEGFVEAAILLESSNTSSLSPRDRVRHHYLLGTALEAMGEGPEARKELDAASKIVAREGMEDLSLMFALECSNGRLLRSSGDLKGAMEKFRKALKVYDRIEGPTDQDMSLCILAHNAVGLSANDLKDPKRALEHFERAESLASSYDPGVMLPTVLHNKGRALMDLRRNVEARKVLEHGLLTTMEIHDDTILSSYHETLGELSAMEGRMEEALEHFDNALARAVSSGNLSNTGGRFMDLGGTVPSSRMAGRKPFKDRVLGFLRGRDREEATDLSRIYTRICRMERERGLIPSMGLHEKAARLFLEKGLFREAGKAMNNLGLANKMAGRADQAITAYRKALDMSERAKDLKGRAIALYNLGSLLVQIGRSEEGYACLKESVPLLRSAGMNDAAALASRKLHP